eukprot:CFRG5456T1
MSDDEAEELRALRQARGARPSSSSDFPSKRQRCIARNDSDSEIIEDIIESRTETNRRSTARHNSKLAEKSQPPSRSLLHASSKMSKTLNQDELKDFASMMGFSGFGHTPVTAGIDMGFDTLKTKVTNVETNDASTVDTDTFTVPKPITSAASRYATKGEVNSKKSGNASFDKNSNNVESQEEATISDDEDEDEFRFPVSLEATITHGSKSVPTVSVDHTGARLITGGVDYELRMYDFNGMDMSMGSFRTIEPVESHALRSIQYSLTGDKILVCAGNNRAQILDRDGAKIGECVRGDRYISDTVHTKGHISYLHGGMWHPSNKNLYMTYGADGTIRLWDVDNFMSQKTVIKVRQQQGRRACVTTAAFSPNAGQWIAGGTQEGGLFIWKGTGPYLRPPQAQFNAHDSEITGIRFSRDSKQIATRSMDDTLKLWDVFNVRKCVHSMNGLMNAMQGTNCEFSPDDTVIVTGTSVRPGTGEWSQLLFIDRKSFHMIKRVDVTQASAICVLWHPRLNQIFVGCADGKVKIFFSEKGSEKGAKLCAARILRKRIRQDGVIGVDKSGQANIVTPHALPMFREDNFAKITQKQKDKMRLDSVKTKRPELPFTETAGKGGRVAPNLTQHFVGDIQKDTMRDQDPREAILKFAKISEDDPFYISSAYKNSQPAPILAATVESDEESD